MSEANQCPKCKKYILGTYCFICKSDIRDILDIPDFMKEIFDKFKEKE